MGHISYIILLLRIRPDPFHEHLARETPFYLLSCRVSAMLLARAQLHLVLVKVVILHQLNWKATLDQMFLIYLLTQAQFVAFRQSVHILLRLVS